MTNVEKIYYMFQDEECKHWFRDNADMLELAKYLDKKGCESNQQKSLDYYNGFYDAAQLITNAVKLRNK
ncbi:MAG: hypothetical protein J6S23_01185 [Clostridia bacterium]|nr:hypothetical protein [Clostridia bacterium]